MRLFLRVLGNRSEAEAAAATRGVPFVFVRERLAESWGYIDNGEHLGVLRSWFNEPRPPEPWPAGTLLYFG